MQLLTFAASLLLLAAGHPVHNDACGIAFTLPPGWTARVHPPREPDSETDEACIADLAPRNWSRVVETSRWDPSKVPLTLVIYKAGTAFDDALDDAGFEHDGDRFGIPGGYGSFGVAEPAAMEGWRGQESDTFFRGFIRDESRLRDGESRVFSGDARHLVLQSPAGHIVGFQCNGGTPDEPVDCAPVMRQILRTLTFR